MHHRSWPRWACVLSTACAIVVLAVSGVPDAQAAPGKVAAAPSTLTTGNNPDFDAVTFVPLTCNTGGDPQGDESPSSVDLVGDASHPAVYYAWDANYVYFRFRVDAAPTGPKGFDQYAWVGLMQVPSGNPFQYQYELSLNGKGSDDDFGNSGGQQGDTIEIWQNTAATDVDFSPLFNDPAEVRLFAERYDYAGPTTANTTPLARIITAGDGSNFGNNPDYFVDFSFPVSVLIAKGVISGTSDIADSLFYAATSANANQYNKDHLACPFLPYTTLAVTKGVAPAVAPANTPTSIAHTIAVTNSGQSAAKGVVISDTAFPAELTGITVKVTPSDASITWTVVSTNPLSIKIPRLPVGQSVTVEIDSSASFTCASHAFVNTATAGATNALDVTAQATLDVGAGGLEICDGKDNNCDGQIDEGSGLCDDGNACNGTESCVAGSCHAGTPLDCNSHNACVVDSCDPASGCVHTNKADGTGCDDGNACTQTDTCQGGACTGGNPMSCAPTDQCHDAGTCNPATGVCTNPVKANGTACDDGNACTQSDTCQNGTCTGTNPVVCSASDPCHVAGTCDPSTGACSNPNRADGTSCNDGDACSRTDTCQAGACTGGNFVTCTASDQCHVAGTCDPSTGVCSNPPKNDGASCNDGNACSQTDTCQAGACVGADPVVCTASDPCHVPGTCNPATGVCSNPDKANGSSCNDGNACSQTDTCQNGSCVGANPVVCTASDQCHVAGSCDPATGACSNPAKTDGSSCDDGDACTQADTCQHGACVGANPVVCTASDQCHAAGACDPATGACSNPAKDDGASCDDGNACTRSDICQNGVCTGANLAVCVASDQCHVAGSCDPATGACSNPAKADGTTCSDGNACTQTDTCQSGVCTGASPVVCTASDPCHVPGTCDAATGACSNPIKSNGTACNDANACTQTDTCQNGTCTGANPVVCTASDQCHVPGTCNTATGTCSNPAKADGTSCNDGNACTQSDTCQSGTCTGTNPVTCSPSDQCHLAGTCNTSTGACSNPTKPNGTACDDGNACTRSDACVSGTCTGTNPVTCTASDQCHLAGTCNPQTGACTNPQKPNGTACNDGNACTANDTCQSGACVGGAPPSCDDGNVCTNDACDPSKGCVHTNNTAPCDDGFACTTGDTCSGGACVGGPPATPDCKDPKTIGFYKRLCMGPHPEDALTQANVECVNDWSRFTSVTSIAQVCTILNPDPSNDKCLQADSQFMAALLNLCKTRLSLDQPISSACTSNTTVGQSLLQANTILANPSRTSRDCVTAQCESEELNSGKAVGETSLLASRTPTGVHLSWQQPPTGAGWTSPTYAIWRRVRGVGSFGLIATVPGLSYDDPQATGIDFEYVLTIAWP